MLSLPEAFNCLSSFGWDGTGRDAATTTTATTTTDQGHLIKTKDIAHLQCVHNSSSCEYVCQGKAGFPDINCLHFGNEYDFGVRLHEDVSKKIIVFRLRIFELTTRSSLAESSGQYP